MIRETTSMAGEAAKVAPPVAVTAATHLEVYHSFINQVGWLLDPLLKLVTIVYTVLMTINLIRKWNNKRRSRED